MESLAQEDARGVGVAEKRVSLCMQRLVAAVSSEILDGDPIRPEFGSRVGGKVLPSGGAVELHHDPIKVCPTFENAQGKVDIAQIIKGVNNALNGCGG
jgi:hypothetical protein